MGVDFAPGPLGAAQQNGEAYREHDILDSGQMIVAEPVVRDIGRDVLPGNDDKQIEINPPDEDERKIEVADVEVHIVAAVVGTQSERPHHRYRVKEQYHIAKKRVWNSLAADDFKVGPNHLADQPGSTTERQKQPEGLGAPLGGV